MKIILFSRQGVVHTAGDLHQMFDAIARFGFDYAVNEEFAPQIERLTGISIDAAHRYGRPMGPQPAESVLVCYGGDGTLLDGIHRLGGAEIPVIGINSGHLGFLTSVPRNGCIGDVFELIAAGKLECQPRSMLEVTGDFGDVKKYLDYSSSGSVLKVDADLMAKALQQGWSVKGGRVPTSVYWGGTSTGTRSR